MNWLNRAENKFGKLAIPGLPWMIAGLNLVAYALYKFDPEFFQKLSMDREAILNGEVWRLITFLFIPSLGWLPDWLGVIFYVMFIIYIGQGLEQAMGAFRLNLYYLLGMIGIAIACFFFGGNFGNVILNSSMLFAFARFFPDSMILLYFLPVKVKWVAWFTAALLTLNFVMGSWEFRAAVLAGLLNYWAFFGVEIVQDARHRQKTAARRERFVRDASEGAPPTMHECALCKRTEVTAPELEFRVARDGQEYCVEHLPKAAGRG